MDGGVRFGASVDTGTGAVNNCQGNEFLKEQPGALNPIQKPSDLSYLF